MMGINTPVRKQHTEVAVTAKQQDTGARKATDGPTVAVQQALLAVCVPLSMDWNQPPSTLLHQPAQTPEVRALFNRRFERDAFDWNSETARFEPNLMFRGTLCVKAGTGTC
jgi:hypothetical protein